MGRFAEEIARAIEGLRPTTKYPIIGQPVNGKPAPILGYNTVVSGPVPPYIAFEHATGYVVITQARFNKLTKTQQSLLLAPAIGEQKPKRRRKTK